jgi:hypothetical protein
MTPIDLLKNVFVALPTENWRKLLFHYREGTRILCGKYAGRFTAKGAG